MSCPISHIFASDLKRADSTALSIYDAQPHPKPALITTQLLREQHFGDAEGQMWMSAGGRGGKFHNGESLDDVARRADRFFEEHLAPIIIDSRGKPPGEINVFVVSHSVTIAENLEALARRSVRMESAEEAGEAVGLFNTAWTKVAIGLENESPPEAITPDATDSRPITTPTVVARETTAVPENLAPPFVGGAFPALRMMIVACNQHSHLKDATSETHT
ncbi:hypothetical protein FRC12_012282 [Ceratobasidium sp. 428]|nr:hypothetical protein FRC09_020177 [Ceratobasidium sp. 395]KAG8790278.1 hypothetical protein FRC12_012282 [Ceratobasidium sp. 428]